MPLSHQVRNALFGIQPSSSFQTNVAAGMRELVNQQYTAARGDRPKVNNIALLMLANRDSVSSVRLASSVASPMSENPLFFCTSFL